MSVLVTGPDTLLGYQVSLAVAESGMTVRLLAPDESTRGDYPFEVASFNTATGDCLDLESCIPALEGATAVFHCESGRLSPASSGAAARAYVEGTRNLLLSMSRLGVEDLVLASSAFVFAPGTLDEPGDETAAWDNPLALQCLDAHRAASDLASRYAEDGKVRCVTVNPTLLLGSGDRPGSAGWWLLETLTGGVPGAPAGGVNIVRAADAAAAAVKALGRGRPGQAFILGGENVPYAAMLEHVALALGTSADAAGEQVRGWLSGLKGRRRRPDPLLRQVAETGLYYSPSRAREQLGLEVTPASETVAEAAAWFASFRGPSTAG